jgi:hypothetical protein
MIMSHDAASGELIPQRDGLIVDAYTKTQTGRLVSQLNCGSRSLDYRPFLLEDKSLIAHHGGIKIHKAMSESLEDIIAWVSAHPAELVLLYISHCGDSVSSDGPSIACVATSSALLESFSIPTIHDCAAQMSGLSYGRAMAIGARPEGGSALAVFGCTTENYDKTTTCYDRANVCYDTSRDGEGKDTRHNDPSAPIDYLLSYILNTSSADPTIETPDYLWMNQAHWQSSTESVSRGTLHNSSVVLDESRSTMNHRIAQEILSHRLKYLNFLELDNVCDNGMEIKAALDSVYLNNRSYHQLVKDRL